MLKFITVIVICYFGKLENNKSPIFGPATIFWTRDNLPATRDTRLLDYLRTLMYGRVCFRSHFRTACLFVMLE